ncbi:MAG: hypothetical protein V3W20_09295, partial [Candidatus Neomarinimicrobiota bacterium]
TPTDKRSFSLVSSQSVVSSIESSNVLGTVIDVISTHASPTTYNGFRFKNSSSAKGYIGLFHPDSNIVAIATSNPVNNSHIKFYTTTGNAQFDGRVGIGVAFPLSLLHLGTATEETEFVDAGSAGATEQDWLEVQIGGVTGYIRVFAAK